MLFWRMRPFRKGDQAAICMNYGRVTHDMLNVHAQDIWQMENMLRANPSLTNSISPDYYFQNGTGGMDLNPACLFPA